MDPDTLGSWELIIRQLFTPSVTMNAVSGQYEMEFLEHHGPVTAAGTLRRKNAAAAR